MSNINRYYVVTTSGRIFDWSALDEHQLHSDLHRKGHIAKFVMPMEDYEKRERENHVQTV